MGSKQALLLAVAVVASVLSRAMAQITCWEGTTSISRVQAADIDSGIKAMIDDGAIVDPFPVPAHSDFVIKDYTSARFACDNSIGGGRALNRESIGHLLKAIRAKCCGFLYCIGGSGIYDPKDHLTRFNIMIAERCYNGHTIKWKDTITAQTHIQDYDYSVVSGQQEDLGSFGTARYRLLNYDTVSHSPTGEDVVDALRHQMADCFEPPAFANIGGGIFLVDMKKYPFVYVELVLA